MEPGGDELANIQSELQAVKKALREGSDYLGIKGETLQRYLLQLNEKENLLLSHRLRAAPPEPAESALLSSSAPEGQGGVSPAIPEAANEAQINGNAAAEAEAAPQKVKIQPREPPTSPAPVFDKQNLEAVLAHMCDYEAVPLECAKAARALSSLAYEDATKVGSDDRIIDQLLRVADIHEGEDAVQLSVTRALCNMAYSSSVALGSLTRPEVLSVLVAATAKGEKKDLGIKASEAMARIVAAEVCPEDGVDAEKKTVDSGPGGLAGLFAATAGGDPSWQPATIRFMMQLVSNEVVEPVAVAKGFVDSASLVQGGDASAGWLTLSKELVACEMPDLPQAMVDANTIGAAASVMERSLSCAASQLAGIEAMSSLVGNRWSGLQAFANVEGMRLIESAMRTHGSEPVIQTKGIRALASGVQWPGDVQAKSGYNYETGVSLTKVAMSQHGSNEELQIAALEALAKYLDKQKCADVVKADGGEGLLKAVITSHHAAEKVQTWGRLVLDGIGVDRNWAPRSSAV